MYITMVITTINPSEIVVRFTNLAILGAPHCILLLSRGISNQSIMSFWCSFVTFSWYCKELPVASVTSTAMVVLFSWYFAWGSGIDQHLRMQRWEARNGEMGEMQKLANGLQMEGGWSWPLDIFGFNSSDPLCYRWSHWPPTRCLQIFHGVQPSEGGPGWWLQIASLAQGSSDQTACRMHTIYDVLSFCLFCVQLRSEGGTWSISCCAPCTEIIFFWVKISLLHPLISSCTIREEWSHWVKL